MPRLRRKSLAGQLVLTVLTVQIFFFSSFIAFDVPTATGGNLRRFGQQCARQLIAEIPYSVYPKVEKYLPTIPVETVPVRYSIYTPQAPIAILLGYTMGWPIATIAAALFVLGGMLGPLFGINPFAGGGGIDYYLQPGFGYLLGMIAATAVVSKLTGSHRKSLRQLAAVIAGTVTLHGVGLIYLLGSTAILSLMDARQDWAPWIFSYVRNLSWYAMPYDAVFSLMLIGLAFPVKALVDTLTSPDMALKTRNDKLIEQRMEELMQ